MIRALIYLVPIAMLLLVVWLAYELGEPVLRALPGARFHRVTMWTAAGLVFAAALWLILLTW